MNRFAWSCVALFLLLPGRGAGAGTVTGLFDLDALPDTLTYSDPDDSGVATIEISLARSGGRAERIVRKYAVSESHLAISSDREGELTTLEAGDTGGSTKYYRTFGYNRRMRDWFLTREIMFESRMSGEGYAPPNIQITYHGGEVGLGGAKIDKAVAETEAPGARSARLSSELSALHESLMGLYKAHKLATMPESAHDVLRLAEMIYNVPVTEETVEKYNNIGFFLGENDDAVFSGIYVLEKVIKAFPERTVAYLNLGDAYFKFEKLAKARAAYAQYIERMKRQGKEKKIPQRVLDRAK